jgi:ATP-dependent RNA helicase DeaD
VLQRDQERMFSDPAFTEEPAKDEAEFVSKLAETFTSEQIATAYLRLYRSRQTAPEELAAPSTKDAPKQREPFGASVWFSISVGRNDRAEPRWLLPMLCRMGDISKDDIGAIRVQETETFVELKDKSVAGFLKALGPNMSLEEGAVLTKLDHVPDTSRPPRFDKGSKARFDKPKGGKPSMASNRRKPLDDLGGDPRKAPKEKKEWKDKKAKHDPDVVSDFKGKSKPAAKDKPRYDDKPAGKPAGKPKYNSKPAGKPKYDSKPGAKSAGKPAGKGKPSGKPKFASDPSQSLRPRGKGKPTKGKGGGAVPKRGGPKK